LVTWYGRGGEGSGGEGGEGRGGEGWGEGREVRGEGRGEAIILHPTQLELMNTTRYLATFHSNNMFVPKQMQCARNAL
jgi:hypothetical protein